MKIEHPVQFTLMIALLLGSCTRPDELPQPATFTLDDSARAHVRKAISLTPHGQDPGLDVSRDRQTKDADGNTVMLVAGEHFFIGFDRARRFRNEGYKRVTVDEIVLFIHPDTADRLRGHRLTATSEPGCFTIAANKPQERTSL